MSKQRIDVEQALLFLEEGRALDAYEVTFGETIDGLAAYRLRKNGVSVPDELVTYEDSALQYDPDFDDTAWETLPEKVDETSFETVSVQLALTEDMREWVVRNDVEIDRLINDLWQNFYRADRLVHGEKEE